MQPRDCRDLRLPHRPPGTAQLLLFAGRRGHGKTTAIRSYLEVAEPRVLALDPFADFSGLGAPCDLDTALADLSIGDACRRRVIPPITGSREWARAAFAAIAAGPDAMRGALLVLDEVTLWSGPAASEELQTLVLQGRRLGIRIACACQRISLVPGVLLSECTELVLFRLSRPRDVDVVRDWAGPRAAEMVSELPVGQALVFDL